MLSGRADENATSLSLITTVVEYYCWIEQVDALKSEAFSAAPFILYRCFYKYLLSHCPSHCLSQLHTKESLSESMSNINCSSKCPTVLLEASLSQRKFITMPCIAMHSCLESMEVHCIAMHSRLESILSHCALMHSLGVIRESWGVSGLIIDCSLVVCCCLAKSWVPKVYRTLCS